MRRVWVILAAAAVAASACGGGSSSGGGATAQRAIQMTLHAGMGTHPAAGSTCPSADDFGSYFAALPGMQVTVTNESGTTVGLGNVPTTGKVKDRATPGGPLGIMTQDCVFSFSIPLDGDAKFYQFDLGTYGKQSISKAALEAANYVAEYDLTPGG